MVPYATFRRAQETAGLSFYVVAASLVTLVTMVWVKQTAFEPLP